MQSDNQLPLAAWGQALAAARAEQNLGVVETARELMLSPAQLRNIESGTMQSFHGSGYYFRAVQKYANRLGIVLDPAPESLPMTDSQLGMQRLSKQSTESNTSATAILSRRQSTLDNGLKVAPFRSRSSRVGMALGVILVFAVALGVYLSVEEGWPNKQSAQTRDALQTPSQMGNAIQSQAVPIKPEPGLDKPATVSGQSTLTTTPVESLALSTINVPLNAAPAVTPAPLPEPEPAPIIEPPPAPPPPLADIFEARFTAD